MWEDTTPSTELPHDFCAGIGPLQLDVVLVMPFSRCAPDDFLKYFFTLMHIHLKVLDSIVYVIPNAIYSLYLSQYRFHLSVIPILDPRIV